MSGPPAHRADAPSRVAAIRPGVWRIRTRMPEHSFGILNSYLLEGETGLVLVDTPWGVPSVLDELLEGIEETGHAPEEIRVVLLTHYHEDHSGAAGLLQERYGCAVAMHEVDALNLRSRFGADEAFGHELDAWLEEVGADAAARDYAHAQYEELTRFASPVRVDRALRDGETVSDAGRTLRVLHTPGHTPGSASYLDEETGILFAGDHVFDRRRSNAVARPYSVARPIRTYWESTRRLLELRPSLVLPGHGEPVDDLGARMARLREVRDEKLAEAEELADGGTAWQIAQRARRRTPWDDLDGNARLAATGEILAYLHEGWDEGRITRSEERPVRWTARRAGMKRGG